MKRIQCRVCREWFEQNVSGICSNECLEAARVKSQSAQISQKPLDMIWNGKLRNEKTRKKKIVKTISLYTGSLRKRAKKAKQELREQKQSPPPGQYSRHLEQTVKDLRNQNEQLRQQIKNSKKKNEERPKHSFYDSEQWRALRYEALRVYGRACMACNAKNTELHVDHIKPRSKHPELELDLKNLQILCRQCNLGKSNKDETNWRK